MRKTSMMAVVLLAAISVAQATYIDKDFDALNSGTYTAAADAFELGAASMTAGGGSVVYQVEDATAKFGAGQSVRLYDGSTSSRNLILYDEAGSYTDTTGVFEFDFYFKTQAGWTAQYMDLKVFNSTGADAMFFRFDGTMLRYYDGSTWQDHAGIVTPDVKHTLRAEFDHSLGSRGRIDLYVDGGFLNTYALRNASTDINSVQFYGSAARQTDMSIDNLQVVPEPATMGLLGLGGLGALVIRRMRG
ncbi:MAG: PEP-CTERM sorting domain-containing protein [Verrucomicrobiota bacterium]